MANTEQPGKRLQKLSGSDFEIADGEPDIRGWDVKNREGTKIGEIEELIFDVQSRKVRYMVVDIINNDYGLDKKNILVPIGLGELHTSEDDAYLPGVSIEQIKGYPEYTNDDITQEHETSVRNLFPVNDPGSIGEGGLALNQTGMYADYYDSDMFNESNLFKNRRQPSTTDEDISNPGIDEDADTITIKRDYLKANNIKDSPSPSSDFSGGDL